MRPILHGDVVSAARLLLSLPEATRPRVIDRLLTQADAADRFRKRLRRAHPVWGNGSLGSAVTHACRGQARALPPERFPGDPSYAACMAATFEAILRWRLGQAALAG